MTRRVRIWIAVPALAIMAALLAWAYVGLPDFGHYKGPYGYLLSSIATPERHMDNVTNATTYDYRGFDTMGEEFILFGAVLGVVLLLRGDDEEEQVQDEVESDLIRVGGAFAVTAGVLVGLWLVAYGFVTPGGGFQGGVAISSAVILVFLAVGYRSWSKLGNETVLDPIEALGAGGYAVVGLGALASGLPFLTNLWGPGIVGTLWSGGSAPLVNWAAGIEVAGAMLVLYTSFLETHAVPVMHAKS